MKTAIIKLVVLALVMSLMFSPALMMSAHATDVLIETGMATAIMQDSALVRDNLYGYADVIIDTPVTEIGVMWSDNADMSDYKSAAVESAGRYYNVRITELTAGATYYYRAYANTDEGGFRQFLGEIKSFTTLPASAPEVVAGSELHSTDIFASLQGNHYTASGALLESGVIWSKNADMSDAIRSVSETFDNPYSCVVHGLEPETLYYYAAYIIVDELDKKEYIGDVKSFMTAERRGRMSNFNRINTYVRGQFPDVSEREWYGLDNQKVVSSAYEFDLMRGNSNGTFNPTGRFSIAEALAVAARVHSIFLSGSADFVQGSTWYQVYLDYAVAGGIINIDDFADYTEAATRAEMAYIFARALPEESYVHRYQLTLPPDVDESTPYYDEIMLLYRAGIVAGSDDAGTFHPETPITRAESAAILVRLVDLGARLGDNYYIWEH